MAQAEGEAGVGGADAAALAVDLCQRHCRPVVRVTSLLTAKLTEGLIRKRSPGLRVCAAPPDAGADSDRLRLERQARVAASTSGSIAR